MYFQKYVSGFKRRPKKGGVFICTFVLLKSTKPETKVHLFRVTLKTKSTKVQKVQKNIRLIRTLRYYKS